MCICIDQYFKKSIKSFNNPIILLRIWSSWPINEPFILWNKHQAVIKKLSKSTDPSIHPSSIPNKKLINWSIHLSSHSSLNPSIHLSTHLSIHPSISWVWYLGRNVGRHSAIFIKFYTSRCIQLSRCVGWIWYLGRNVDRLQSLSSTPVCAFSLAGVSGLSAEFGTLGGMLIGCSH